MSAPYAPFMDPRTAKPPGVSPLDPADWLRVDADFASQMAERDRLFRETRLSELVATLPEGEEAAAECVEVALGWLARDPRWRVGPATITRPDGVEVPRGGLAALARAVAEDILVQIPGDPEYRLVAGALLFPSRWTLAEKLGRPLTAIHAPVPHYAAELSARVNRLFAAIRPEAPLVRVNWLVHPTDALRQPQREAEKAAPPDLARGWWLRTERQCLVRLPCTRAVVFTIKTTLTPVGELDPAERAGLRAALGGWSASEIAHRGGEAVWRGALAALG